MRMMSVPSLPIMRMSSHTSLRLAGSSPVVGSSDEQARRADKAGAEVEASPHTA